MSDVWADRTVAIHALSETLINRSAGNGQIYAAVCTCGWQSQPTVSEKQAIAGFNGHKAKKASRQRVNTAIRFPPALHERLSIAAAERDLTLNFLVTKACEEFIERLIPASELRLTRPAPAVRPPSEGTRDER